MNIVKKAVLSLAIKSGFTPLTSHGHAGSLKFFGLNNPFGSGKGSDERVIEDGYASNTDVYAIINKITECASSIPYDLYKKTKDGKELVTEGGLYDLLQNPNQHQTIKEFKAFSVGFLLMTGDYFLKGTEAAGMGEAFRELNVLASNAVEVVVNTRNEVTGYVFTIGAVTKTYTVDEVWHGMYFNPTLEGMQGHRGLSPLAAGFRTLTASNHLITADAALLKNHGATGMITSGNADVVMTDSEAEKIQNKFNMDTGGPDKFGRIKVTSAMANYQQIGMSPTDLKIIENSDIKLRALCRLYGVDSRLFGDKKAGSLNGSDRQEAEKALFTQAAIPVNERIVSYLNRYLIPAWDKQDKEEYIIEQNIEGIEALQSDKLVEAKKDNTVSDGITKVLASDISNVAKVWQLINVYGITEEESKKITADGKPKEETN